MSVEDVEDRWLHAADDLLGRIASILDAARGQIVRTVNHATVSAYWHIGREVVEALQQGNERATYGKALIERLALRLTERYGKGFSATNLGYFRQFYLAYRDRIPHPPGGESQRCDGDNPTIGLILCSEKNEAVARYSVLHESQQLFASRYRFTLPSEEELQKELRRERALIETRWIAAEDDQTLS